MMSQMVLVPSAISIIVRGGAPRCCCGKGNGGGAWCSKLTNRIRQPGANGVQARFPGTGDGRVDTRTNAMREHSMPMPANWSPPDT